MSPFNLHTPDTIGVEWKPTVKASKLINGPTNAGAFKFTATATENVDQAFIYIPYYASIDLGGGGSGFELEVYETSNLGALDTTVEQFVPAKDLRNVNGWAYGAFAPGGTQTDIYRGVDDYPASLYAGKGIWPNTGQPVHNDQYVFPIFGTGYDIAFSFLGIDATVGTKRVTRVTLKARVNEYIAYYLVAAMGITPYLSMNGVRYMGAHESRSGEAPEGHLIEFSWYANPATGCAWRASDLDDFDSVTGTNLHAAGFVVDATGSANNLATILQLWLEVEYSNEAVDPRVAVGCVTPARGWTAVTMADPVTGSVWAKQSGTEYLVTLRRRFGSGQVQWRYLGGPSDTASAYQGCEVQYTADTLVLGAIGDDLDQAFSFAWAVAGVTSVDSQPYASLSDDDEPSLSIDEDTTSVDSGRALRQEFTTPGANVYTWMRAVVQQEVSIVDGSLTFTFFDAGDVQLGSPIVFQSADLVEPRDLWQTVEGTFGVVAAVTSGTVHYVEVTSNATPGTAWRVQTLSTFRTTSLANTPSDMADATHQGDTDVALVDAVRILTQDRVITVATQPDAVADFAAVVTDHNGCLDFVALSWTASTISDGGGFRQYELERQDDGTWYRIANVTTSSATAIDDWESKRNTSVSYRIRVRRVDWSASPWVTVAVTPTMVCCGGLLLTSNVDPTLSVYAPFVGPEVTSQPQNVVTYRPIYGRDYQVGFHGLEYRGKVFTRTLALASESGLGILVATVTSGDATYVPLRGLLPAGGAGLPYVAAINELGDRWLVSFRIDEEQFDGRDNMYMARVTFTEVGAIPYPIDVGA